MVNTGTASEMQKNASGQIDISRLYHSIWQFREAALLCLKPQEITTGVVKVLWSPMMVLNAFACELELKYIYFSETGETINEHNLSELYYKLPETKRKEIERYFSQAEDFANKIVDYGNVFVTWRYKYEYAPITEIDASFLVKLQTVLFSIVESYEKKQKNFNLLF